MGASKSATTNTQQTVSDSYNQTTSNVANLSDVGNISLSLGGGDLAAGDLVKLLPLTIVAAAVLIVGFVAASRSR
jgi:hypothetical protein